MIAGPKDSKLLQKKWLQHSRLLSSQAQATASEPGSDRPTLAQSSSMIEHSILSKRRPLNIDEWREQRAAVFQNPQDKYLNTEQIEKTGEQRIPANDHARSVLNTSVSIGGRKKDQWRNRAIAGQVSLDKSRRSPIKMNKTNNGVSRSTNDTKPKKGRWRNRPDMVQDSVTSLQARVVETTRDSKLVTQRLPATDQKRGDQQNRTIPSRPTPKSMPKILRDFEVPAEPPTLVVKQLESWKVHKYAVKKKLNGQQWDPLKKLSPDARQGVRELHAEDPKLWSTPNLAQHFEISPDAIRRILKSKWEPTEQEKRSQEERWVKRGETIWDRYVELGKKAPRRWRGLDPVPAPKRPISGAKVDFKPEEWSQERVVESEQESTGMGLGLGTRII